MPMDINSDDVTHQAMAGVAAIPSVAPLQQLHGEGTSQPNRQQICSGVFLQIDNKEVGSIKAGFWRKQRGNQNANQGDIWNFRDQAKQQIQIDEGQSRIIKKKTTTTPYIVEMAEEEDELEHNNAKQATDERWEIELAQNISNNLGTYTATPSIEAEEGMKKRAKGDITADRAEEAGHTTPHPGP
ncbi:hypothetical protein PIB30_045646 [Stylosanthes scabra]|uniref:Uncharacterized protein n=1 Tax=Stylosanthes scabra TaxID=79078 RepID=A0ABU6WEI1_9FABA|nr:hypothetical protein [Stylosanthes scabra]